MSTKTAIEHKLDREQRECRAAIEKFANDRRISHHERRLLVGWGYMDVEPDPLGVLVNLYSLTDLGRREVWAIRNRDRKPELGYID